MFIDEESNELKETVKEAENQKLTKVYHQTVKKVTEDYDQLHFNTAISQLMIFLNEAKGEEVLPKQYAEGFVQLLAPIAPHLMEELWQKLGHAESISEVPWPTYDEALTVENQVEIVLQINGKVKAKEIIALDLDKSAMEEVALRNETIQEELAGKTIRRVIAIPNRLVNIVAN